MATIPRDTLADLRPIVRLLQPLGGRKRTTSKALSLPEPFIKAIGLDPAAGDIAVEVSVEVGDSENPIAIRITRYEGK
jgi:hypothetical protein